MTSAGNGSPSGDTTATATDTATAANTNTNTTDDDRLRVLTFELGGGRYCVDADAVASVLDIASADGLDAAADPWNAGSVTVTGEQVRVVDLHQIFEATSRPIAQVSDPMLLVLTETDDSGRYYGWLVDDVDVTKTVSTSELEPTRASAQFVIGRFDFGADEDTGDENSSGDGDVVLLDERAIHG